MHAHPRGGPIATMATDATTIDFLLDQLGPRRARYSTRRMFGEYCLYRDGLPVAFVCDDVLFLKDTLDGRAAVATAMTPEYGPPYPGAKPYLRVSPDRWDDSDWLYEVLERTAAALPPPKARNPRPRAAGKPLKAAAAKKPAKRTTRAAPDTKPGPK